jgi:hypothetical protein
MKTYGGVDICRKYFIVEIKGNLVRKPHTL